MLLEIKRMRRLLWLPYAIFPGSAWHILYSLGRYANQEVLVFTGFATVPLMTLVTSYILLTELFQAEKWKILIPFLVTIGVLLLNFLILRDIYIRVYGFDFLWLLWNPSPYLYGGDW